VRVGWLSNCDCPHSTVDGGAMVVDRSGSRRGESALRSPRRTCTNDRPQRHTPMTRKNDTRVGVVSTLRLLRSSGPYRPLCCRSDDCAQLVGPHRPPQSLNSQCHCPTAQRIHRSSPRTPNRTDEKARGGTIAIVPISRSRARAACAFGDCDRTLLIVYDCTKEHTQQRHEHAALYLELAQPFLFVSLPCVGGLTR
jgi:hypothetical protein